MFPSVSFPTRPFVVRDGTCLEVRRGSDECGRVVWKRRMSADMFCVLVCLCDVFWSYGCCGRAGGRCNWGPGLDWIVVVGMGLVGIGRIVGMNSHPNLDGKPLLPLLTPHFLPSRPR